MKLFITFDEIDSEIDAKFVQTECTFFTDYGTGISFSQTDYTFSADLGEIFVINQGGGGDMYEGPYNVIPRVYQQVLRTNTKSMADNVTVEIIPLSKTINQSNGYTVTIG